MSNHNIPGSGGFVVTDEMRRLLGNASSLSALDEQRLHVLYQQNSMHFSPALLNPFAHYCYRGNLRKVKEAVESGTAPDLLGQETAYKHGYAALPLFGVQRYFYSSGPPPDYIGTLKYLLKQGAPVDVPDIAGYTALHHATMALPRADIARVLLEHGADPDYQDVFGCVPLIGAFQNESLDAIEVLMEFGARLDIAGGSGYTPDSFFIKCGPKVTAVVQKWKRKREGAAKPLDEKACATCGKAGVPLKFCGKCHATWYCSKECQKDDWKKHKNACIPFSAESTVTVVPFYAPDLGPMVSMADMARQLLGHPYEKRPERNSRSVQVPRIPPGQTKQMIIKVQVPMPDRPSDPVDLVGDLLVYDKKRSFVCRIRRRDCSDGYLQLSNVVRTKGVMGAKAYFSAEMKSPDALVVKVSEVLAEQAF